jgi:DNA-binding transcriptional regulator YhcF (GntR family)
MPTHLFALLRIANRIQLVATSFVDSVYELVYSVNMLTVTIDRSLKVSVYEQVASQIRQLVASGALVPGTTLPPVRQLATELGVNLNTVARAYRLLKAEGFLVTRERTGVSVAAPAKTIGPTERASRLGELRTALARLRQAGMEPDELRRLAQRELLDVIGTSQGVTNG